MLSLPDAAHVIEPCAGANAPGVGCWTGLTLRSAAKTSEGSLQSGQLSTDTGALSFAMHTSERHEVEMAAAMSPEASPPYSATTWSTHGWQSLSCSLGAWSVSV